MKTFNKCFHAGDVHHRKILVGNVSKLLFNIFNLMFFVASLSICLIVMANYSFTGSQFLFCFLFFSLELFCIYPLFPLHGCFLEGTIRRMLSTINRCTFSYFSVSVSVLLLFNRYQDSARLNI